MSASNKIQDQAIVNNILNEIQCPVMFTPLTDAVKLLPCMHTISEIAAQKLYGQMGRASVERTKPCPECRINVTAYYPDLKIRSIVQLIVPKPENLLPVSSAMIAEEKSQNLPFPGKGAKFVHTSGKWAFSDIEACAIRELVFTSSTPDSTFSKMCVCGYRDGSIRILVAIRDVGNNKQSIENYCREQGLVIPYIDIITGSYITDTHRDLKTLFRIIATNNEIPQEYFPLIRNLVQSGNWKNVPPITENPPVSSALPNLPDLD